MNKISIFFLVIAFITYDDPSNLSNSIDTLSTEPYHHFDWLDEDEYSITIKYIANDSPKASKCCLWNGTNYCKGVCSGSDSVTCKFTGASCGADGDNPATKYYYGVYCSTNCDKIENAKNLRTSDSVDVTVAVKSGSFIKFSIILLIGLFAF